jgi:hypothetical protein
MNMNVFCPICKAEYNVVERSTSVLKIKFVCHECDATWVDNFNAKESDDMKDTTMLNSLALAEINNTFGEREIDVNRGQQEISTDLSFKFETTSTEEKLPEISPSENFPDLRIDLDSRAEKKFDAIKEIAIEKRLRASSELLKKAREEPKLPDNTRTQKKGNKLMLFVSSFIVFLLFTYNFFSLFTPEITNYLPMISIYVLNIESYLGLIFNSLQIMYLEIVDFITTTLA